MHYGFGDNMPLHEVLTHAKVRIILCISIKEVSERNIIHIVVTYMRHARYHTLLIVCCHVQKINEEKSKSCVTSGSKVCEQHRNMSCTGRAKI